MNLQEIKDIIKREGGKIIIVENDKPEMVIMSFDEWRGEKRQEIRSVQTAPPRQTVSPTPLPEERSEELTIDDLPL